MSNSKNEIRPKLIAKGWWGKKEMTDPLTGKTKLVQLGSNSRLRTIFDTNMRMARAHGEWQAIERSKHLLPFLKYSTAGDARVRHQHRQWDGVILPVGHPWWDTHFPPCGWKCRCGVVQLNQRAMDKRGLSVTKTLPQFPDRIYKNPRTGEIVTLEQGIDPGFNYNVGKSPLRGITARPADGTWQKSKTWQSKAKAAIDGFLRAFDATAKDRIIKDKHSWPIIIGRPLFLDALGKPNLPNIKSADSLPQVADALKNHDRAFWVWGKDKAGKAVLIRRYEKDGENEVTRIDFNNQIWNFENNL